MSTPPPFPPRLFLALWPAPETAAAMDALASQWHWPATARRTRPERLHITLHFIGAVPPAQVPPLQQALGVRWSGCDLILDHAEVWKGGIAVLEATQVPQPLQDLQARLGERLQEQGLPVETRRFRPHVTLARKAQSTRPPPAFPPVRWRAGRDYVLVQSLPGGRGYEPLQRFS